jgi:MFS family permease/HAMP domain-containing protein
LLRNPAVIIVGLVLLIVLIALTTLSGRIMQVSEEYLAPELKLQGIAVGLAVRDVVEFALELGIPLGSLNGMEPFLEDFRNDGQLAYVAISGDNILLFQAGEAASVALEQGADVRIDALTGATMRSVTGHLDIVLPIRFEGLVVGGLHTGLEEKIFAEVLRENMLNILTVFLLSLLLAKELTMLVMTYSVTGPLSELSTVLSKVAQGRFGQVTRVAGISELRLVQRTLNTKIESLRSATQASGANQRLGVMLEVWREPRLAGIRVLAFLFVMAEEIARPFLPQFLGERATDAPAMLTSDIVAGVIMTVSMLVLAFSMPAGGAMVGRLGPRRLFFLGACVAAGSLVLTGFVWGFWPLLALRALSAVGYALCYIACQSYVVQAMGDKSRARGMGLFVGGIMMADLFGAASGGILADMVGPTSTFAVAGGIALLAGALVWMLMEPLPTATDGSETIANRVTGRALGALLVNKQFLVVALLAAVPTKLVMVGVLYFLVPNYLTELDLSQGDVGRVIMAYGFFAVIVMPFAGPISDNWLGHRWAVILGSFIAAPLLLMVPVSDGFVIMLIAVGAMGFGQALTTTSTLPLLMEVCADQIEQIGQGPVLGTLRLIERFGAAFAPLLGAVLAAWYGYPVAIACLGGVAVSSAVLLGLLTNEPHFVKRGDL